MKRLIICSDGTWCNEHGVTSSYVKRMCDELAEEYNGVEQHGFYDSGIGSTWNSRFMKYFTGAFGIGLNKNILDCYAFLVDSYEPGDEIYLFGFSRGAYTVRSLAGLIRNCGILKDGSRMKEAFALYRNKKYPPDRDVSKQFRKEHAVEEPDGETKIKFLGVFDTVGSLGIPAYRGGIGRAPWHNFHDTELSHIVRHARHALAIDEARKQFPPTLWDDASAAEKGIDAKQVWFAGVHSDIGGTFKDSTLGDCAGEWMAREAAACGLGFSSSFWETLHPAPLGKINAPGFPQKPRRKIPTGALLHQSVKTRHAQCPEYCIHKALQPFYTPETGQWKDVAFFP